MCVAKDEAKTKLDHLIEAMERLAFALENRENTKPQLGEDSQPIPQMSQEPCLGNI